MPSGPRGNPANISTGPGYVGVGPLLTPTPTNLDVDWDAAVTWLGYTNEGSTQSASMEGEPVRVAEELEDLDYKDTSRAITVGFMLAENTARNLEVAMNGGTIVHNAADAGTGARAFTTFEPPVLGSTKFRMIFFESEDGLERIIWRQCKQVGSLEMARRQGAEKAAINCEFRSFVPAGGGRPFIRLSGRGADALPQA